MASLYSTLNQPVLLVYLSGPLEPSLTGLFSTFFAVHLLKVNFKARIGKVEDDTNAFRTAIDAFGQDDEVSWDDYIRVFF